MKFLYLIRHAKSSWSDLSLKDIDRPLNERGKKDAPRMGKRLKEKKVAPDIVLTSPAQRAFATCEEIARCLDYPLEKIKTDKRLYHANDEQLFKFIQELPDLKDKEEVVLIVGHNPGLTDFANSLLHETIDNIPTCGIVAAEIMVNSWCNLQAGAGKMLFFDFPKSGKG